MWKISTIQPSILSASLSLLHFFFFFALAIVLFLAPGKCSHMHIFCLSCIFRATTYNWKVLSGYYKSSVVRMLGSLQKWITPGAVNTAFNLISEGFFGKTLPSSLLFQWCASYQISFTKSVFQQPRSFSLLQMNFFQYPITFLLQSCKASWYLLWLKVMTNSLMQWMMLDLAQWERQDFSWLFAKLSGSLLGVIGLTRIIIDTNEWIFANAWLFKLTSGYWRRIILFSDEWGGT